MIPNQTELPAWDSDAAPWATLSIAVTINFNCDVTYPSANPLLTGAYDMNLTASGNKTKTYTFTRAAPDFDNPPATNAWNVIAGAIQVGEPVETPFQRSTVVIPTQASLTDALSDINLFGYLFGVGWGDNTETWNIPWAITYTLVGTPPYLGPSNSSGTETSTINVSAELTINYGATSWLASVSFDAGSNSLPEGTSDDGAHHRILIASLGQGDTGPDIDFATLKTGGGSINFGVTLNDSKAAPSSPVIVNAWSNSVSVVLTCS